MNKKAVNRIFVSLKRKINAISNVITFKFPDNLTWLFVGLSCFVISLVKAWKFTLILLLVFLVFILNHALNNIIAKKQNKKIQQFFLSAGKIAHQALASIRTVYAFGLEKWFVTNYRNNLKIAEHMAIKQGIWSSIFSAVYYFLVYSLHAIGFLWAYYVYKTSCDTIQPGSIIMAFLAFSVTMIAAGQIIPFVTEFLNG